MRSNSITDEDVLDLAFSLLANRNIITLDLSGSIIEDKWFELNKYIHTKYHPRLPSLSTTLFRNNEIFKNPVKLSKWNVIQRPDEVVFDGHWTKRREWEVNINKDEAVKSKEVSLD